MKANKSHPLPPLQIAHVTSLMVCNVSDKGKVPEVLNTGARVKPFYLGPRKCWVHSKGKKPFYLDQEKRERCPGQGTCFLWRQNDSLFDCEEWGNKFRKTKKNVLNRRKNCVIQMEIRKDRARLKYYKILYVRVTIQHNYVPCILQT